MGISQASLAQMACNDVLGTTPEVAEGTVQGSAKTRQERILEAQAQLVLLNETLEDATEEIKKKLVGMDSTIDEIARRIYNIWDAKANMRPLSATSMMSLFGFSGVGKTAVIEEFSRLLNMTVTTITISQGSYYIPVDKILANGRPISPPADGDPGPISLNLDFIILIDEIQNLKSYEERQAYVANRPTDPDLLPGWQETTEKMKQSEDALWSILGSGFGEDTTTDPTRTLNRMVEVARAIKTNKTNLIATEKRISELEAIIENPESTEEKRSRAQGDLRDWIAQRESLTPLNEEYRSEIEDTLETMKVEFGASMGSFANMPTDRLADYVIDFSKQFSRKVLKNYKELRKITPKKSFSEGLFFVAGNPEEIIADLTTQAMDRQGRIDPTILRRLTEELNPEPMRRFFFKLFGSERAGWQTRWGLSKWRMLKPFSEEVWKQLVFGKIRERVQNLEVTLRSTKSRSIEFVIDDSLVKSLYETEVDPAGGGRQSSQNLENVLATLSRKIPGFISRHISQGNWTAQNKLYRVRISAVPNSTDLRIIEEDARGSGLDTTFPLVRSLNQDNQIKNEVAVAPLQQAIYQAARAVVGTVLMGSFPRSGVKMTPSAGELIENSWAKPDIVDLRYLKNKMAIAVAGAVGERLLIEDSGVVLTTQAELDKAFITEVISEIRKALLSKAEIVRTRHPNEQVMTLDLLYPNSSIRSDEIIRSIYERQARSRAQQANSENGAPAEDDSLDYLAVRALDRIAENIITSQPDLIAAIAAELTRKPIISPAELQQLFRTYANQRPEPSVSRFQAVFNRARTWLRRNPQPIQQVRNIQLGSLFAAQPGSIQNPLSQVSQTPAVRPGPRTLTQRLGDRMKRYLREVRSNLY